MVGAKNCVLVALVACLPVAVLAPPAAASQAVALIVHPQDDWAGSQIARYEGGVTTQDAPVDSWLGGLTGSGVDVNQVGPAAPPAPLPGPSGLDVSSYQGNVNWAVVAGGSATFSYTKATESTTYVNPYFAQQYNGPYNAGMSRGAYHFATPNTSDGASQANYFLSHGGGWSADGRTLPPAVDLEYNPYGQQCYGMTPAALVAWVHAFVDTVHQKIGRYPAIYTSTSWWALCMGNDAGFGADPLWIARYNKTVGGLPPGWSSWSIWQFADSGKFPGDQDTYNGSMDQLRALTRG